MPYSYGHGKKEIAEYILTKIRSSEHVFKILDVGCGAGTYSKLLKKHNADNITYVIEGVEVVKEYVEKFKLYKKYDYVYSFDITCDKVYELLSNDYDLIIMGDVLEHLSITDAQKVLSELQKHTREIIIAIPYLMKQSNKAGKYEEHLQSDLTREVFQSRYPQTELLFEFDVSKRRKYAYWRLKGDLWYI